MPTKADNGEKLKLTPQQELAVGVPSVSRRAFEKKVCMVENSSQSDWYVIMIDRQWPNQMRFRKPIPPKSRI
jgi:hypothetical protein